MPVLTFPLGAADSWIIGASLGSGYHRLCIDRIKVAGFGKAVEAHRGTGDCRSQVSARAVSA
jgi:hypothetical protein